MKKKKILTIQHLFRPFAILKFIFFFRFAAEIRPSSSVGDFLPYGEITDYTELVDVGDIFNPTTGTLSINDDQQEGSYVLHVSARKSGNYEKEGRIWVYKNQEVVQEIFESDEGNWLMMNAVFTLHLQKDDEVKLYNDYDESIYVNGYHPFTFTGYKI